MRTILELNNRDLLSEIDKIELSMNQRSDSTLAGRAEFNSWLMGQCLTLKKQVAQNLLDLALEKDEILADILSNTNYVVRAVHQLNRFFLSPILRSDPSDKLCLELIQWLHTEHPMTRNSIFGLADGSFASLPYPPFPTVYFVPPSAQRRLLYLALLFHEFGHLLYACHKHEMDSLVRELQREISSLLEPAVVRNDAYSTRDDQSRRVVVERWYEWTQEIFCDAVGLTIGGPAFAESFSMYLRMLGSDEFHLSKELLENSDHPVTWIRIKLLADRSRLFGLNDVANDLENSWDTIAERYAITENYFGYFSQDFIDLIQSKVTDMLTEAEPRKFRPEELDAVADRVVIHSWIALLNLAWKKFFANPEEYNKWEEKMMSNSSSAGLSVPA